MGLILDTLKDVTEFSLLRNSNKKIRQMNPNSKKDKKK